MCDLASWKKTADGKIYFMDNIALAKYRRDHPEKSAIDCRGHAAIEEYYCCGGIDHECTDFSTPDNFPSEIVSAIKAGRMSKHNVFPEGLIQPGSLDAIPEIKEARSAYEEAWSAYKESRSVRDEAWSAYMEAWSAYRRAWAVYEKARSAYKEARSVRDEARSAYKEARSAYKEARSAYKEALTAYMGVRSVRDEALTAYKEARSVRDEAQVAYGWKLFRDSSNRIKCWK